MPSGVNVGQSARDFMASVDDFRARDFPRAIAMALNRTMDGIRVDASREMRARYKLKVATVNKAFTMMRASENNLTGIVRVRGFPLNLGNFSPRQTRKGVTVNVKGARKLIPHAFILPVSTKDGESTFGVVFIREDPRTHERTARLPIRPLTSVDVPSLFVLEDLNRVVSDMAQDRFANELGSAVQAILARG